MLMSLVLYAAMLRSVGAGQSQPVGLGPNPVQYTASPGVALYTRDGTEAEALLRHADTAMYKAKLEGRSGRCFYDADLDREMMRRLQIETALGHQDVCDGLSVVFQPQFRLSDTSIIGAEALLRWTHPELGMVSPGEFIPIAESTKAIMRLGAWIMEAALAASKAWAALKLQVPQIAINVSPAQFANESISDMLLELCQKYGVPTESLEVEITEFLMLEMNDGIMRQLNALRAAGVGLALDDFGTGYASMRYLLELPITRLKIDRSFVTGVVEGRDADRAVVEVMVDLGHRFGASVLAEGVETQAQLEFLKSTGCDEVQGYLLARPQGMAGITKMLSAPGAPA
jgi:EAL domain-containing protein (putative c-di-GMP-specific phosphodiesterase class I)